MKNSYCRAGLLVLASMSLAACVTINIYFPAAAAEKAADKIIEDVWQLKKERKPEEGRQDTDESGSSAPVQPSVQPQPEQPQQ